MKTTEEIRHIVHATMETTIEDLKRLVRIPSIANGILPRERVVEAANETKKIMQASGLQQIRIIEIPGGYPAVYGEVAGPPGAPTVLLYAHYDVVPAEPLDLWESPPFEPTTRDGRLYGRGTADDKSGIVANAATLRVFGDKPPVNIKVIVEGEEEYGDSLGEYVIKHPDMFEADAIVVADLGNPKIGQPTLITALRGEASLTVEVRTMQGRLHSGNFGGPVPDALIALMKMLATLHDQRGNVAVKGLERKEWQGGAVQEDEFRKVTNLLPGIDFIGDGTLASQIWASYAITVIGMDVPSVKASTNALVDMARARISVRIPPGQDSNHALDLLAHHLEGVAPWHAQVKISDREVGTGFAAKTDGPAYDAARRAMREVHGKEARTEGRGGSIPLISVLAQAIPGAEIILWGAQDLKSVIHAPNESVDQQELERLVVQQALFFQEYSQMNVAMGTKATRRKAEGASTASD